MSGESSCYTVIFEDTAETPSTQELRSALEKGSDEDKLDTLRRIIVATINGNPQVSLHVSDFLHARSWIDALFTTCLAYSVDANHPVHHALEAQAAKETTSLLLGGLPEVRRKRKVEARDDSCRVRVLLFAPRVVFSIVSHFQQRNPQRPRMLISTERFLAQLMYSIF